MTALLAALLLAVPAAAPAPDQAATALARKVQAYYEGTRDLEARFEQTYTYAGLGRRQLSSGTLRVKKPGMMRWDYAKPTSKTVAVKGLRLVQYEPEENQAYVDERFDASAMSAAVTFLLGQGDLAREFALSSGEGGDAPPPAEGARPARRVDRPLARSLGGGGRDAGRGRGGKRERDQVQRHEAEPGPAGLRLRGEAAEGRAPRRRGRKVVFRHVRSARRREDQGNAGPRPPPRAREPPRSRRRRHRHRQDGHAPRPRGGVQPDGRAGLPRGREGRSLRARPAGRRLGEGARAREGARHHARAGGVPGRLPRRLRRGRPPAPDDHLGDGTAPPLPDPRRSTRRRRASCRSRSRSPTTAGSSCST